MRWWAAALVLAACGDDAVAPMPDASGHLPGADASIDAPPPDAAEPTILFRGNNLHPADLAVDDLYVYWFDAHPPGRVMRTAKTSGDTQVLADQQGQMGEIAIDISNIYWTGSIGLLKLPKSVGAQPTTLLAPTGAPLASDADALYVVDLNGVVRVPKIGGGTQTIAIDRAQSIVAGSFGVVWTSAGSVKRLAPGASSPETLAMSLVEVGAVGADDAHAYFIENVPNGVHRIASIAFSDHAITTLFPFAGNYVLPRIVVDGNDLYFSDWQTLYRMAKAGGGATPLAQGEISTGFPVAVATDTSDIFTANFALGGKFSEFGSIQKLPK